MGLERGDGSRQDEVNAKRQTRLLLLLLQMGLNFSPKILRKKHPAQPKPTFQINTQSSWRLKKGPGGKSTNEKFEVCSLSSTAKFLSLHAKSLKEERKERRRSAFANQIFACTATETLFLRVFSFVCSLRLLSEGFSLRLHLLRLLSPDH